MTILEKAVPISVNGAGGSVRSVTVRLATGEEVELETDFVFLGTGERPTVEQAQEALGIEVAPPAGSWSTSGCRRPCPASTRSAT